MCYSQKNWQKHQHNRNLALWSRDSTLKCPELLRICIFAIFLIQISLRTYLLNALVVIRGGTDKSLARPISRCRRTESIVFWKERSVHVPNWKSFLVTGAQRKHVRQRARFQQHRDASCYQVFFFLQGKAPKEIHAILTLGEHAPSYATVKN